MMMMMMMMMIKGKTLSCQSNTKVIAQIIISTLTLEIIYQNNVCSHLWEIKIIMQYLQLISYLCIIMIMFYLNIVQFFFKLFKKKSQFHCMFLLLKMILYHYFQFIVIMIWYMIFWYCKILKYIFKLNKWVTIWLRILFIVIKWSLDDHL